MKNVEAMCTGLAKAVISTGVVTMENAELTSTVLKAEIYALLWGDEYANERAAILAGTVSQQTVLASVTLACVAKIGGRK